MKASLIEPTKPIDQLLAELDSAFMEDTLVVPVSLDYVDSLHSNDLRVYCNKRAIYTVVTHELLTFLGKLVDVKQTIEIGSGNGTLSRGLGIKGTDNKMQEDPMIAMHYFLMKQPTIRYPSHVEKIDGIAAIKKYKPHTVIGSWLTHRWNGRNGNQWSPDEEEIMANCERYILIGNEDIHDDNKLFDTYKYNHKIHRPACLRSRSSDPELDYIVEFTKK